MKWILFAIPLFLFATANAQIITTIAGNGSATFSGDGSPATATAIYNPTSVALGAAGDIYVADRMNNRIRKINALGIVSTIAGNGLFGYTGDGFPATDAELYQPLGIAVDLAGNTYITFYFRHYIRKISNTGIITTIGGDGFAGSTGDGGPATAARFYQPWGMATDRAGNLFVADQWNHKIRKIDTAGIVTTVAGSGVEGFCGDGGPATLACLYCPNGVAVDGEGNIYIGDAFNNRVRKVNTAGIITTLAGNGSAGSIGDGSPATAAELYSPGSVAVDASRNVYIADAVNNKIRKVNTSGIITTYACTGVSAYSGDGGPATAAEMGTPFCVVVDSADNIYLADHNNNRVRKVSAGICIGSSITLNDSPPGGTWSSGNPSIATIDSITGVATGLSAGIAMITYTIGASTSAFSVRVDPFPVAGTIVSPDTVCVASTIILTDAAPGGTWVSGNAKAAVSAANLTGIAAGRDTVYYIVTNSCATVIASKAIQITPLPNAGTITGLSSVCAGAVITLTDTASGGAWSTSNATATVSGGVITGIVTGIDTIKYTVSNSCGTTAASKIVTVNPLPVAGTITGLSSVCVSAVITLVDVAGGGVWSTSNATATVSGGVVTGITAGIDTIVFSVTNVCGTAAATKIVTVNPLPDAGTITGPSSVCSGAAITLADAASGGVWSTSNAVATVSSGVVTGITVGIDTVMYTVTNICGTAAVNKIVTVNPLPDAGAITGLSTVCAGDSVTLADTAAGGAWSTSNAAATVSGGVVTGISAGIDTIVYTVINICGTASITKIVTVNPLPNAGAITGASSVCPGTTVTLVDTAGGTWSASNSHASVSGGVVTGITAGIDTVQHAASNMCGTAIATHIVTVNPTPHPAYNSGCGCVHGSYLGYQWYHSSGAVIPGATDSVYTGVGCYYVKVDSGGCTGISDTVCTEGVNNISSLNPEVYIYPNPVNAVLTIICSDKINNIVISSMVGQVVFRQVLNAEQTRVDVADLPPGIYIVRINDLVVKKFIKE